MKDAKVDVFKDDTGKLYVVPKPGSTGDDARTLTFYGDGKTMYQQRVTSSSGSPGTLAITVWSPRARGVQNGSIEIKNDGANVICAYVQGNYVRRPLEAVAEGAAKKLMTSATFLPPLWERRVWFFGRGDGGTYYLVDALRDEAGGAGLRLFIGPKGRLKEKTVVDSAVDTNGSSVIVKGGELVIPKSGAATWKAGKKSIEVAPLEPDKNSYLIYRELGVYGQLGTVCEDQ